MGFFWRLHCTFANSRGGLLLKMDAASIVIDDCRATSKTTIQNFKPQNMLNCQIILKENTYLIIFCLEKKALGWASFRDGLLFAITFANSRGGLHEIKLTTLYNRYM